MVERGYDFVTDHQPAEGEQPGIGPFDFPTPLVSAEPPSILSFRAHTAPPVGADQFDAAVRQLLAEGITVVGPVCDHANGFLTGPSSTPRDPDVSQGFVRETDFRGRCRGDEKPKR